jgi:hypothetical protein
VLLGLWSACPGSVSRLDFGGAGEAPWSPPRATRGGTTRGRRLDERPWYTDRVVQEALANMAERIQTAGGQLEISSQPYQGTQVVLRLPE